MSSGALRDDVAVVAVLGPEPTDRLERMLDALRRQVGVAPFPVVLACDPSAVPAARALDPGGAVRELVVEVNPSGERSRGLNLALRRCGAATAVRVDARSLVPETYVSSLVARLRDVSVGLAGATQQPIPAPTAGVVGRGIARALANPLALGGADYRRNRGGPTDTVYLGALRVAEVLALGGYDEDLLANEDFDLAARVRRAGRAVWLEPDLYVAYEARSTLRELFAQYYDFGTAKARYWRSGRGLPNARQSLALALVAASALAVGRKPTRGIKAALLAPAVVGSAAEAIHARSPAPWPERAAAAAALAVVYVAWPAGVMAGLLTRSRASARARPSPNGRSPRRR